MNRPLPTLLSLSLAMLLFAGPAGAVSLDHSWSQSFGDAGVQEAEALAVDGRDNIFLAGQFDDEIDLGGGLIVSETEFWQEDHFLAKFDPNGNFVWGVPLHDDPEHRTPEEIATDSEGNVVVFGTVVGGQALNPRDVWFAKYDGVDGSLIWSRRFGDGEIQNCWGGTVDAADNVYLTGSFWGTIDFGGGPLSATGTNTDVFAARFDADGNHVWSSSYGDASGQFGQTIRVDAGGNMFLTGDFAGTIDFGGASLTATGPNEIYLAKLDAGGNHLWSRQFAGSQAEMYDDMITSPEGSVLVAGQFWGTLDFGGGPRVSDQYDAFVATYDADGQYVSDLVVGGPGSTQGIEKIALDDHGVLTVLGAHQGGIELGGVTIPTAGLSDIWLARFNPDGTHLWSTSYGGADWDVPRGLALDGAGNAIVGGYFFGYHANVTLNVGGPDFVNVVGEADVFLASYSANATAAPILVSPDTGVRLSFASPSRRGTTVHYSIPNASPVRLSVLDVSGRVVATLLDGRFAHRGSVSWDGRDRSGATAASGVYFVRLETEVGSTVRKLVLID